MVRHGPRPLTGSIWRSFDLYGPKQAEVTNIADHAAGAPDVVNGGFPFPGDARDFLEDAFLLIDIEGGKRRSTGKRVAGVGVAVRELDGGLRTLRHGLVHMVMDQHAAHGNGAVAHPLRAGDEVGCNAKSLGGKGRSQSSEAGDDLIEDQQDAVLAGDLAQPLEIALGRRQHAAGASHRLDDDGCDGRGIDRR